MVELVVALLKLGAQHRNYRREDTRRRRGRVCDSIRFDYPRKVMPNTVVVCPECGSKNVHRRNKMDVEEVSMDELPAEDEKPSSTTTYSAPPHVQEKVAECLSCGYTVEYKVVHDRPTAHFEGGGTLSFTSGEDLVVNGRAICEKGRIVDEDEDWATGL